MIITVDVGGTKTLVSSFDKTGAPGEEYRFETPKIKNDFISQLLTLLEANYTPHDISSICVALPGMVNPDGSLAWAANLPWHDLNIKEVLAKHYTCPILLENDANLAALAEANTLKPIPALCLYISIGTGIGTGIITRGSLDPALSGSEAGHMIFNYDGQWRNWETFASGHAINEQYGLFASEITDPQTWEEIAERLAVGFITLIPTLQPNVIVIGGSIGTHFEKYKEYLLKKVKERLSEHIPMPSIVQAQHPEEAVIYGCYYYAVNQFTTR